jgi:hypothetical protein
MSNGTKASGTLINSQDPSFSFDSLMLITTITTTVTAAAATI